MVTHWLDLIIFSFLKNWNWPKLHDPIISSFLCLKLGVCLFWGDFMEIEHLLENLSARCLMMSPDTLLRAKSRLVQGQKPLKTTDKKDKKRHKIKNDLVFIYIYIYILHSFLPFTFPNFFLNCQWLSGSPIQLPHLVLWPLSLVALALEVGKWWISCRVCNQICLSKVAHSNENHLFVSSGDFKLVVISSWLHHVSINRGF